MDRRALTAALSGAAVALTGALTGISTLGTAQAAEPGSPLVLDAPDRVVARSHDGRVYSNLGVRMTAQGEAFELRAHRPTYDDAIETYWHREGLEPLALPEGSMTTWQGVDDFTTIRILQDGKRVKRLHSLGCFNGEAQKVGPDGPASNPYPWGCPWNPYTLGSVMGVAEDYSASLLPDWGTNLRLEPGVYELVAVIEPQWRQFFGISRADGKTSTRLVVRKARDRWRSVEPATAARGVDELEPTLRAPTAEAEGEMVNEFAPDLRALPAFDISLNEKGTALRFGATVWNGGHGPMVIEGFREDHDHVEDGGDHTDHMTAYQYFFDGDGQQTGYEQVGEFGYHAANHDHWHFEDFARYRLFSPDTENPDQPGQLAVRSTKASFCLVATDAVDYTVPNADWRPEYTDLSSQCGGRRAQSLRQVLSNGSGDTYHQYRAGQAFRIGDLPDGRYFIGIQANPDDRDGRNLSELDYTNNDSYREVEIGTNKRTGRRWVRSAQVGIIEELMSDFFFRSRS